MVVADRRDRGQALVLSVVALAMLLGMAAFAIDVGSWFHVKRNDQAVVDAAALAGAQALPEDPAQATALAISYAGANGITIDASNVTFSGAVVPNDTITVRYRHGAPTFFSKALGIATVSVGAQAAARSDAPQAARFVAPIVVPTTNTMLQCNPPPCTNTTQISLMNLHGTGSGNAAGSFALLDLNPNDNGNVGAGTLAGWMASGDQDTMPLGTYYAAPSSNFNSSDFQAALQGRVGSEVLFPVYKPPILNGGSNGEFNIVGWVAFHIDAQTAGGSSGTLVGHFTRYIAQGLQASTSSNGSDFGVRVVQLVQ